MRLSSQEQWDQTGFAMQVAVQTLMSMHPRGRADEINNAIAALQESIDHLEKLGVFSKDFDPTAACY